MSEPVAVTKEEQAVLDPRMLRAVARYRDRMKQWIQKYSNMDFPLTVDKSGELAWLNRSERRTTKRNKNK